MTARSVLSQGRMDFFLNESNQDFRRVPGRAASHHSAESDNANLSLFLFSPTCLFHLPTAFFLSLYPRLLRKISIRLPMLFASMYPLHLPSHLSAYMNVRVHDSASRREKPPVGPAHQQTKSFSACNAAAPFERGLTPSHSPYGCLSM